MTTPYRTDMADAWQPVVAPRPANYVPAAPQRQPSLRVTDGWNHVAVVDVQPVDVTPALNSVHDASRDSTSATDRAWGYNIRLIPAMIVCLLLAGMGTLAFVLAMRYLDQPTDALTNTFAFLLFLAAGFFMFAVSLSRTDYAHSRAGVERHRITTAADLRREEISAMLETRREALRLTLQLLDSQQNRQIERKD